MSNNYKFVDNAFENEISQVVIQSLFPLLNATHKTLLLKYTVRLINLIALIFGFYRIDTRKSAKYADAPYSYDYLYQLKQNNYQDIKWLINHLLPFINEENDITKITSFDDIYLKKKTNVDINLEEPKYVYSNLQFNRCIRDANKFRERSFNESDLHSNFCILIDTLKTMSNKMHVNWVDILPYTLKTYKETELYRYTKSNIETNGFKNWNPIDAANLTISDEDVCKNLAAPTSCLQLDDIYNTISHELYQSIKNIKWLIYDIYAKPKIYPMIVLLRMFFNLKPCLAQTSWEDFVDKQNFENTWNNFLFVASNGDDVTYGSMVISNTSLKTLFSGFIFSFDKGASNQIKKSANENGYIATPKSKKYSKKMEKSDDDNNDGDEGDDEGDDEDIHSLLAFTELLKSLKSLSIRCVYDFMSESLQKFKNTWYGTRILTDDKKDIQTDIEYVGIDDKTNEKTNIPLTYKNVYNFAKSFSHIVMKKGKPLVYPNGWEDYDGDSLTKLFIDTNFIQMPQYWRSLDADQKTEIIKRLNQTHSSVKEWFNISKHTRLIRKIFIDNKKTGHDINKINEVIYKLIMDNLSDILFEALIFKGVLTKFIPEKTKTNRNYVDRDNVWRLQSEMFRTSDNNDYWTSAYHYLTNIPHKYMDTFIAELNSEKKRHNYFSYALESKSGGWYLIDAYNWVAQIGFCHHFIHNRVQFITGATGVGKSTEIPKLFLYYSKAISYIQNPKLICTEPRIEPTRSNASRIAVCLGLPISEFDEMGKEINTENYYIQTKYGEGEPHAKNVSHAMLQYATDGVLILEASNPVMKNQKYKSKDTKDDDIKYTNVNTYDIIMIDEAHEHKINMDLLLTIFRHAVTYNNSLKLVILSATMDADEPKYRRYFRNVNDNRKYPLDTWVRDNKLDKINVDRRYHISPPATTTRYKVNEFYKPGEKEQDVIKEILRTSTNGDILVFEPSQKKILELVNFLNKTTAPDIIAIPYYSKMEIGDNEEYKKKFVGKIQDKLKLIKMNRSIPLSDPIVTQKFLTTGNNTYKRAIIIATNIAEASITLPSVKFVVDTGTQIIMKYDYKKRTDVQETVSISESSRLQRKGRVGRTSPGDVYYLYQKGSLENNTIDYEISTENLTLNLFGRLKKKDIEKVVIDGTHDPNSHSVKLAYKDVENYFNQFGLTDTIKSQWFLGNKYFDYYGNDDNYDYSNYETLPEFYETGFNMCNLTDNRGKFYLIHPNELDLKRNIVGQITGKADNAYGLSFNKDQSFSGYISSKKIISFWQMLLDYMYITFNDDKTNIITTTLGDEINTFLDSLKKYSSFHGLVRMIIFAKGFGCYEDAIKLAAFYMTTMYNPLTITQPTIDKRGRDQYKSGTFNNESESYAVLNVLNKFHEWLIDNKISDDIKTYGANNMSELYNVEKYGLTRNEITMLFGPEELHTLELNNKISSERKPAYVEKLEMSLVKIQMTKLKEKQNDVMQWCDVSNVNIKTIIKYLITYSKLKNLMAKNFTQKMEDVVNTISTSFKKASILIERNIKPIELALLFGFPFNVCKKMGNSTYYLSLYSPNFDNIYTIQSSSKFKYKPNVLIREQYFQKYILYLSLTTNSETDQDTLSCIHKIEPELFTILSHIYSEDSFKKITSNDKIIDQIEKIINNGNGSTDMNLSYAIISYTQTIKDTEKDTANCSDLRSIEFLKGFSDNIDKVTC